MCELVAQTSNGRNLRVVLDPQTSLYGISGSATLHLDSIARSDTGSVNPGEHFAAVVSGRLIGIYAGALPFLLAIGFIAAVAAAWRAFSVRTLSAILSTAVAAWIVTLTLIALLAVNKMRAFTAVTVHDFISASYIAIAAACLSLIALSRDSRPE